MGKKYYEKVWDKDDETTKKLYDEIKDIALGISPEYYIKKSYLDNLCCTSVEKEKYYHEYGSTTFLNVKGDVVNIEFTHWHQSDNDCNYKLYYKPFYKATITVNDENIWEVSCTGDFEWVNEIVGYDYYLVYKVSDTKLPMHLLLPKLEINKKEKIKPKMEATEYTPVNKPLTFDNLNDSKKNYLVRAGDAYSNLIMTSVTFDKKMLAKAITTLLKIISNDDYQYKTITEEHQKIEHFGWYGDTDIVTIENNVDVIVQSNYKGSYRTEDTETIIYELINNGDIAVAFHHDNNKVFVLYKTQDGKLVPNFRYNKNSYIKEFIDYLIQYRYQREITDMTDKDISICIQKFIEDKTDIIQKNHNEWINQKIKNFKS